MIFGSAIALLIQRYNEPRLNRTKFEVPSTSIKRELTVVKK